MRRSWTSKQDTPAMQCGALLECPARLLAWLMEIELHSGNYVGHQIHKRRKLRAFSDKPPLTNFPGRPKQKIEYQIQALMLKTNNMAAIQKNTLDFYVKKN